MLSIVKFSEKIFSLLAPVLKPKMVQRWLRKIGVPLPYRYAKYLEYRDVVDLPVYEKTVLMLSQNTPIEITAFWKGIFGGREGAELRVWCEVSKKVDVVLDIGANTGIYSLVAAAHTSVPVYAFEPVPLVFEILKENIAINTFSAITPVQKVVSEKNGEVELYIPKEGWVDVSSVEMSHATRYAREEDLKKITCSSITVDSLLQGEGHHESIVLAKVDVEGAEKKVVEGMAVTMQSEKIIVLAELLNQAAFDEVVDLLPESYSVYGVISAAPYVRQVDTYVKGVKNYFLLPTNLALLLTINES